uniref:Uncharacterized protein n=1 Tax=Trypanosoma vivax (strain Y486) TaxID=1055687 RepID=G0TZM1_TRYVY|nr:conserved hypothetical protein [Trypanosoma vivax Y486]
MRTQDGGNEFVGRDCSLQGPMSSYPGSNVQTVPYISGSERGEETYEETECDDELFFYEVTPEHRSSMTEPHESAATATGTTMEALTVRPSPPVVSDKCSVHGTSSRALLGSMPAEKTRRYEGDLSALPRSVNAPTALGPTRHHQEPPSSLHRELRRTPLPPRSSSGSASHRGRGQSGPPSKMSSRSSPRTSYSPLMRQRTRAKERREQLLSLERQKEDIKKLLLFLERNANSNKCPYNSRNLWQCPGKGKGPRKTKSSELRAAHSRGLLEVKRYLPFSIKTPPIEIFPGREQVESFCTLEELERHCYSAASEVCATVPSCEPESADQQLGRLFMRHVDAPQAPQNVEPSAAETTGQDSSQTSVVFTAIDSCPVGGSDDEPKYFFRDKDGGLVRARSVWCEDQTEVRQPTEQENQGAMEAVQQMSSSKNCGAPSTREDPTPLNVQKPSTSALGDDSEAQTFLSRSTAQSRERLLSTEAGQCTRDTSVQSFITVADRSFSQKGVATELPAPRYERPRLSPDLTASICTCSSDIYSDGTTLTPRSLKSETDLEALCSPAPCCGTSARNISRRRSVCSRAMEVSIVEIPQAKDSTSLDWSSVVGHSLEEFSRPHRPVVVKRRVSNVPSLRSIFANGAKARPLGNPIVDHRIEKYIVLKRKMHLALLKKFFLLWRAWQRACPTKLHRVDHCVTPLVNGATRTPQRTTVQSIHLPLHLLTTTPRGSQHGTTPRERDGIRVKRPSQLLRKVLEDSQNDAEDGSMIADRKSICSAESSSLFTYSSEDEVG